MIWIALVLAIAYIVSAFIVIRHFNGDEHKLLNRLEYVPSANQYHSVLTAQDGKRGHCSYCGARVEKHGPMWRSTDRDKMPYLCEARPPIPAHWRIKE